MPSCCCVGGKRLSRVGVVLSTVEEEGSFAGSVVLPKQAPVGHPAVVVPENNFFPPSKSSENRPAEDTSCKEGSDNPGRRLIKAAKRGDVDDVSAILNKDPQCIEYLGMWNNTALIVASQYAHKDVALLLLERGSKVQCINEDGCTAFHFACLEGLYAVVHEIIEQVSRSDDEVLKNRMIKSVNMYNSVTDSKTEMTPMQAAATNGHERVLRMLLKNKFYGREYDGSAMVEESNLVFKTAVRYGRLECINVLLQMRPHLEESLIRSDVLYLCLACHHNHHDVVQLLLKSGSPINGCSCSLKKPGEKRLGSPLSIACSAGEKRLVYALLERGANPNYTCSNCSYPLTQACRSGDYDCVQALLTSGAFISLPDPVARITPLEFVRNARMKDILQLLQNTAQDR